MAAETAPQVPVDDTAVTVATTSDLPAQTENGSPEPPVTENPSAQAPPGTETNGDVNKASLPDKLLSELGGDDDVTSTEVTNSGSENDLAKSDSKGHSRTSSSKRPATFKSLAVNRTFLGSKTASSTSVPKPGEKPTTPVPSAATLTSTSSTPKPRLVAKSAAGLRDASKLSMSQSGRPAPNASAVWNKNQPVPVPDPKKFTDEELAKIGIHMASRLQHTDETKGQSNWADIDEDDEDWAAPDAFTWSDGTKTTIPHVDETPTVPDLPVIQELKTVEAPPSSAAPSVPATSSPAVKPVLPSGKGLVLKAGASSEKPTLVAKPPAPPTPVKSPWASLPAVPKVSPMEGAAEPPQRGFGSPSQAYVRGGPPPAAREIAADDFSRSPRRDNQQLFNSQSGRYEPVPDRRGVTRADYPARQPAVLQRPMHSEGPAEPSAAFQTTHTSGGYGRRRGSSNVSGGSGSFQRSKPFDQPLPSDSQDARRSSLISDIPISASPGNHPAPGPQALPRQSPYQTRVSPAMSTVAPQPIPDAANIAPPQPNMEDTVEFQKKLMQERRAQAIKRRQEQEAKEEAEKKERLAKKLAALGPPPERKGAKKEDTHEALKAAAEQSPTQPEASEKQTQVANDARPASGSIGDKSPVANGVAADPHAPSKPLGAPDQPLATDNKHGHPWAQPQIPPQPEPTIWGSNIQGPRSVNVWGAPNNDRTLGNGSFNAGFDAHPSQTAAVRGGRPGPGPIGPPRATAQARSSSLRQLGPIGPPRGVARSRDDDKFQPTRNKWAEQVLAKDHTFYTDASARSAEVARNLQTSGLDYTDIQPQIKEEFTQTDGDRNAVNRETATYSSATTWQASSVSRQDVRPDVAAAQSAGRNGTGAASQQSRFFPSSQSVQKPEPLAPDTGRPPEEDGHPAFDGDARRPHVSLPREKPLVKLPPSASAAPKGPQRSSQPAPSWGQQLQHRDDVHIGGQASRAQPPAAAIPSQEDKPQTIMERIHALFKDNKQPSSVNSSSRTAYSHPPPGPTATVSLPVLYAPPTIVDARSFVTKTMDEECFEEQEMGSLPAVHIPSEIPEAAYNLAKAPPRRDKRLVEVVPTSAEDIVLQPESRNSIVVHLPHKERKTVAVAVRSPVPRRGGGGGRSGSRYVSSSHRGSNRGQESSATYVADQAPASISGAGSERGRGRGGRYRGRGSDWSRASAPVIAAAIQTQ